MEKEKQIEDLAELIDELNRDVIIGYKPMKNGMIADIVKGRTAEEKAEALMEAGYGNVKEAVKEALQKEREKEIKKQEAFAEEMGFAPDASPYYIARKYKEKFEYAMKELAEARKETFMEIMEMLRFGYELPIDDIAREMAKGYGVEVCDEK